VTPADQATWAEVWIQLRHLLLSIAGDLGSRLSPLNVFSMIALAFGVWLAWRPAQGFLAWIFPARIYRTQAFWLDVRLFLANWGIALFITVNSATIATATALATSGFLGLGPAAPAAHSPLLMALVVFVVADLALYGFHRFHHQRPALWAIHALHHSAEEMSPVSAFRNHPIYSLTGMLFVSLCVGLVQGLAVSLVFGAADVATLAGTNLFSAVLNLGTANLRHSHIRLRYPSWVEHVLISPAQHQIHHSIAPEHYNRNFGEVLALWDWAFGTLYVTKPGEAIRFGLGDSAGRPLPQRHPTFVAAMIDPITRAWAVMRGRG
jgi:sterol desaturase/sphingolipid hydroxylase (fatty acid hydroxylase superfamily)